MGSCEYRSSGKVELGLVDDDEMQWDATKPSPFHFICAPFALFLYWSLSRKKGKVVEWKSYKLGQKLKKSLSVKALEGCFGVDGVGSQKMNVNCESKSTYMYIKTR